MRNKSIDICRIIGTFLVILAHVPISAIISNIRSFDVILLVFISGFCIHISGSYLQYVYKRFRRLVVPGWILLLFLFISTAIACLILKKSQLYSFSTIIYSFFYLERGIGYIWIIRIYIGIAVIIPLFRILFDRINSELYFVILSFLVVNLLSYITKYINSYNIMYYLEEIVVYGMIAYYGDRYNRNENIDNKHKFLIFIFVFYFLLFLVTICFYKFNPNNYKYPPQIQYISYGVICSCMIYKISVKLSDYINKDIINKIIIYLSQNSFILYLVHIFFLSVMNVAIDVFELDFAWYIQYIGLVVASLLGTYVINIIINSTKIRIGKSNEQKKD